MAAPLNRIYIAVSLDGCIATADGGVSWLDSYQSEDFGYDEFVATVGTIVMGRATYDQVLGFGDWPYVGKRCIVVTSQPLAGPPDDTVAFQGSVADLVASLPTGGDGGVWVMGGASLIQAFLEMGAVDVMELFVMPVLLGGGLRLFDVMTRQQPLSLASTHAYPSGVVKLTYALQRVSPAIS